MTKYLFPNAMIIILTKLSFLLLAQPFTSLIAQPIDIESREFRLLMNTDKINSSGSLENASDAFLKSIEQYVSANYDTSELKVKFDIEDSEMREIKYLDIKDHQLYANDFSFSKKLI